MDRKSYLLEVITTTADFLAGKGEYSELDPWISDALKTVGYYGRAMWDYIISLYRAKIDGFQFVEKMMVLIAGQMRRAWNEGMRANGLDPKEDMTAGWEGLLQGIIADEENYMVELGTEIEKAAIDNTGYDQFRHRVDLWTNRYNDVVNRSTAMTAPDGVKMMWKLGETEKHCPFCKQFNGIVAFAKDWESLGVFPQNPPNFALTGELNGEKGCGGWNCDCKLEITDQRRSPNAYDTILNIVFLARG